MFELLGLWNTPVDCVYSPRLPDSAPPALITDVIAKRSSQIVLFRFRIFPYPVHGRLSQPFPRFLSQLGGGMQRELLLHAHLVCLNRFDAYMQFSR